MTEDFVALTNALETDPRYDAAVVSGGKSFIVSTGQV